MAIVAALAVIVLGAGTAVAAPGTDEVRDTAKCTVDTLTNEYTQMCVLERPASEDLVSAVECAYDTLTNEYTQVCVFEGTSSEGIVYLVECTYDALTNDYTQVCVFEGATSEGVVDLVKCTYDTLTNEYTQVCVFEGATGADGVTNAVVCAVENLERGTAYMCHVETSGEDPISATRCALRNLVQGTPQPCVLDPTPKDDGLLGTVKCVYDTLTNEYTQVCPVERPNAGPGDGIRCALRNLVQGTPQPCPL